MTDNRDRIERLGSHHDRAAFSSGVEPLDRYLRERAGQDQRRRVAAVFVLVDGSTGVVSGYYTLSALSIRTTSLPANLARRLPRYDVLPVVLLGRLAVDARVRGRGLGGVLLADALRRARAGSDGIAAMAVVVDAKDDAARGFYERHGFRRFVDDEFRLSLPMADIQPF